MPCGLALNQSGACMNHLRPITRAISAHLFKLVWFEVLKQESVRREARYRGTGFEQKCAIGSNDRPCERLMDCNLDGGKTAELRRRWQSNIVSHSRRRDGRGSDNRLTCRSF